MTRATDMTAAGDSDVPASVIEDGALLSGWPQSATSRTVDLDGPVHYLEFASPGEGPVLVCVHGLGGSGLNWGVVAPLLSQRARIFAVDLVGHGASRSRAGRDVIEDNLHLLETFVTQVCRRPVVLVGHSLGGVLAMLMAVRSPELVERLVLLSPPVPRPGGGRLDLPLAVRLWLLRLPGVGGLLAHRLRHQTAEQIVDRQLRDATPHHARIAPDAVAAAVAETRHRMLSPDWAAAQRAQYKAILGVMALLVRPRAMTRRLAQLRRPVLWLQGQDDPKAPVEAARSFAATRTDWVLETVADTGHLPHLEDPAWTARQIKEWLNS